MIVDSRFRGDFRDAALPRPEAHPCAVSAHRERRQELRAHLRAFPALISTNSIQECLSDAARE